MKKIFTLFVLFMLFVAGASAKSTAYAPTSRTTSFSSEKLYMIFNTAYSGGSFANRWGAIYFDGSVKTYGGAVPTTFTVTEATSPYLFKIAEAAGVNQYELTTAGGSSVGTFTIANFVECPSTGNVQTRNDDGTYTQKADITADMNLVYIYNGSQYWNGNNWNKTGDNCFATWSNGHPYAVYEVEVVTTVDVTYILMEGSEEVTRTVVTQNANSAVAIPSTFGSTSMYDFNVEGTIGEEDCEVVVTRTVKAGIVTALSELSNGKAYTLTAERGSLGVNDSKLASTYLGDITEPGTFSIVYYEENYYLYSLDDEKFIVGTGAESDEPTTTLSLVKQDGTFTFLGKLGTNGINITDVTNGVVVNSWVTADPGNTYLIKAVSDLSPADVTAIETKLENYFHPSYTVTYRVVDGNGAELWVSDPQPATLGQVVSEMPSTLHSKEYTTFTPGEALTVGADNEQNVFTSTATFNLPFKTFTDYADATWYKATIRTSKYVRVQDSEPYYPASTYEDANEYKWAFEGNPYTGFAIYNKAAGESKTLGLGSATINNAEKPTAVMTEGVTRWEVLPNSDGFVLLLPGYENYYVNQNGGASGYLGFWISTNGRTDDGSTWRVEEILSDDAQLVADLTAAISALSAKKFGSDYGQYSFTGEYEGYKGKETMLMTSLLGTAQQAINDNDVTTMASSLETLQSVLANITLNMPQNGSAFRIKSDHGTYLPGTITSGRYVFQDDADATTIWFLVDDMLYNYTTGQAFMGRGDATSLTEFGIEAATGADGTYVIRFRPDSGTRRWLWAWAPDASKANQADQNGAEAANTRFYLEAVTEIPVEVTSNHHEVLYLPVGVQAVEGVTLNSVTSNGNGTLALNSMDKVAANTPVVVKADVAGVYNLPVVADGETPEENLLTGVARGGETVGTEVNAYVLGSGDLGAGFFRMDAEARNLMSWQAYYVPAEETEADVFYFSNVTGLSKVSTANDSVVFDLSGRRVEKAQKGIYILNGKKVLVK